MERTECRTEQLVFQAFGGRQVVAAFDSGRLISDGGVLPLREVAEGSGMLRRFARCFVDHRNPDLIEHTVEELVSQRILAQACGRRFRHGVRGGSGSEEDDERPRGVTGEVQAEASRGQDAPDRVRQASGRATTAAWRAATGDVRLSRVHALLRVESERQLRGEASDRSAPGKSQAASAPRAGPAATALACCRTTSVAVPSAERALRLLWSAEQLASRGWILRRSRSDLVRGPLWSQPATLDMGPIRRDPETLPSSQGSHPPPSCRLCCMTRVTLGGSRVRETARSDPWGRSRMAELPDHPP